MCGITGLFDLTGRRPIDRSLLEGMNGRLSHRGPDGDGFHLEPGVGFGHRRLSIIDLEGGAQPLYNEDRTVVVTYNGEIYNFREIEKELRAAGYRFQTRCDTEVIVHAWEEWGTDCLARFNGMFVFAIWDRNQDTLFVARDRAGIKPLYYAELPSGLLAFASELKSLTLIPELPLAHDPQAIESYLTFGYVPDPKTIYSAVHKLEPGHWLKVRRGQPLELRQYWDVPLFESSRAPESASALAEGLVSELTSAVERRLIADVPLGAFLSGGIDSSAVVAMMRRILDGDILTCSIGFDEAQYDESEYARRVAEQNRTDHRAEIVKTSDYDLLDELVGIYDEPYADSSAIPTYRVCELARKHVTVCLSGDGGDENYIGYRRYNLFNLEERARSALPQGLRQGIFGPLGRFYPKLDWAPRFLRGKTTFQSLARSSAEAYLHGVSISPLDLRESFYSSNFKAELQGYRSNQIFNRALDDKEFEDPLRMVQYLDFKTYLPGDILTKVDRASMAHSLEVRVPFLDYQFVEWTARVPTAAKLKGTEGKHILKKAMEPYLPHDVLYRKKMGFAVPIEVWFRGALKDRIRSAVTGDRLLGTGWFEPKVLDKMVSDHISGRRNYTAPLWSLLMLDGFLRAEEGAAR